MLYCLLFWVSGTALGNISSVRGVQIIALDAKVCNKCMHLFKLFLFLLSFTLLGKAKRSVWVKCPVFPIHCKRGDCNKKCGWKKGVNMMAEMTLQHMSGFFPTCHKLFI